MSNFLAVATVTEALRRYVAQAATADLGVAVDVRAQKPPAEPFGDPTVTVFCYLVTPNGALRNRDGPTRGPDGRTVQRPEAALDLHYLVSFYGDEAQLVPQRLLGSVTRALYDQPALLPSFVQDAATAAFLLGTDLGAAPDRVRFTPTHLDIDDLYKLWTMMTGTPFALSLSYLASVVVVNGTEAAAAGPPVATRTVSVVPAIRPVVTQVMAAAGGAPPVEGPLPSGSTLVLRGRDLAAPGVTLRIGTRDLPVPPSGVRADEVRLDLPADLPPGVFPLRLLQDVTASGGTVLPRVLSSAEVALVREPGVTAAHDDGGGRVSVTLDLAVGSVQRAELLLDELNTPAGRPARSSTIPAPFPLPARPDERLIAFPPADVPAGDYLVRVRVDGATSPLTRAADGSYTGPALTLAAGGG